MKISWVALCYCRQYGVGAAASDRGFILVDVQLRINVPHIFALGDIVGQSMLAHKALHEAHVAAEVSAGTLLGDGKLANGLQCPIHPVGGLRRSGRGVRRSDRD